MPSIPSCQSVEFGALGFVLMAAGIRCFCGVFFCCHSTPSTSVSVWVSLSLSLFYLPRFLRFYFYPLFGSLIYNLVPCLAISISWFGCFSVSFPFCTLSVERLISIVPQSFCKMFRLCFIVVCFLLSICQSCRLIVPAELLNGCIFDPMIVSVSHAGFSINRDNCNTAIAKHVFAEQPLVYYGRAKSVKNNFN